MIGVGQDKQFKTKHWQTELGIRFQIFISVITDVIIGILTTAILNIQMRQH